MQLTTVLVDRDGTLIHEYRRVIETPARVRLRRPVIAALGGLSQRVICISNQSAIGRGEVSRDAVDAVNMAVAQRCRRAGVAIEAFLICPHAPWEGCRCRKPGTGLFEEAQRGHGVVLAASLFIGNRLSDALAGTAAGCAATLLLDNVNLRLDLGQMALPPRTLILDAADLGQELERLGVRSPGRV